MCHNTEHIEIYDQKKMLCEYTTQNKTCGRRIVNKDTIVYSVNVEKDVTKKYDPDQYVFCAWHRGSVSIQIVWGTDKPKNLKAEAICATSLKVTWDAPVNVHLDSTRYLLEVGEVRKEFPYNDFNGTYTIDGLTPGQKYKVLVHLNFQNPHYLAPAAEIDVET
ncbi:unnamed protein product [Schistocephalus solidus]|uniref:Fibronectin type-III domain-containing protein n=1 Tax=Schistocephalus solidus TaxID=70667 RepID=A0A183TG87_SCHSO|nr:unnamed protein product [Schistocephalus solidus]